APETGNLPAFRDLARSQIQRLVVNMGGDWRPLSLLSVPRCIKHQARPRLGWATTGRARWHYGIQ
ncbi:MAG: hypothetical protein OXC54_01030, partial [Rhodospirillaceae bacterium]|nr:hypothetical protein [Rhodospirillaceae bacterium]